MNIIIPLDQNLIVKIFITNQIVEISILQQITWNIDLPDTGTVYDSPTSFLDKSRFSFLSNQS